MTIPVKAFEAFVHVESVPTSIAFYEKLGFKAWKTIAPEGAPEPTWAAMESGERAVFMLAKASAPIDRERQGVLFYLYVDDVKGKHAELTAAGIECGEIRIEFYAPGGEFRVVDPDGYVLMITHT